MVEQELLDTDAREPGKHDTSKDGAWVLARPLGIISEAFLSDKPAFLVYSNEKRKCLQQTGREWQQETTSCPPMQARDHAIATAQPSVFRVGNLRRCTMLEWSGESIGLQRWIFVCRRYNTGTVQHLIFAETCRVSNLDCDQKGADVPRVWHPSEGANVRSLNRSMQSLQPTDRPQGKHVRAAGEEKENEERKEADRPERVH